jgi:hypothetical protein
MMTATNVWLLQKISKGNTRKLVQILAAITLLALQEKISTVDEPILGKILKQFN